MVNIHWYSLVIIIVCSIVVGGISTGVIISRTETSKYNSLISRTNKRVSDVEKQLEESRQRNELLATELDRANSLVSEITKLTVNGSKHIEGISEAITECFGILDRVDALNKNINSVLENGRKSE